MKRLLGVTPREAYIVYQGIEGRQGVVVFHILAQAARESISPDDAIGTPALVTTVQLRRRRERIESIHPYGKANQAVEKKRPSPDQA